MIEGTQLCGLARQTQRNSILHAAGFARFYHANPGHTDLEEIRQFHPHLSNDRRLCADDVNQSFPALQLLCLRVLKMPWSDAHCPRARRARKVPLILRRDGISAFFEPIPSLRCRVCLATCYRAGLRVYEAIALKAAGAGSQRMLIRVRQGKGGKNRSAMRRGRPLKGLRLWWRPARPARSKIGSRPFDRAGALRTGGVPRCRNHVSRQRCCSSLHRYGIGLVDDTMDYAELSSELVQITGSISDPDQ